MGLRHGISLLASLLAFPAASLACSCLPPKSLADLVSGSKHVFIARITQSTLAPDKSWIEASFEVEEEFKGEPSKVPSIKARISGHDYTSPPDHWRTCPEHYISPGMHFIVFAPDDSPVIYANCSATHLLKKRSDPLVELVRSIRAPR